MNKIKFFYVILSVMVLSGCSLLKGKDEKIEFDVSKYVFLDDELDIESENSNLTYEIVGDNEINARLVDGKIVADKPGVIEIIAKDGQKKSEPRIVYVIEKDETVIDVVLSADLLKMDLGKIYSFGLDLLPNDAYKVESSDEAVLKVLENNNIEIVGSGRGNLKITNNLTNKVIYDDMFVVYNSILLTEIKTQLINQNVVSSMNSTITQEHFDYITTLDLSEKLSNDSSIALGIKYLRNLETLSLSRNELTDISFVDSLKSLKTIDLSHNNIEDISALNGLINLESINLSYNNIINVSTLRRHQNILDLDLSHNNISDLSPVSTLYDLESLFVGSNPIDSIDHISALIKLKKLDVSYSKMVADEVFGLDYFTNLEYIDLSGINLTLSNIPKNLPNLEVFKINDVNLLGGDLIHLLNYNGLKVLEIENNDLDLIALETFARNAKENNSLTNLEVLSMGRNNMVTLPDLSMFSKLRSLGLSGSKNLMNLTNLELLVNLEDLDLSYTQSIENNQELIETFSTLTKLKRLNVVDGMNYFDRELFDYFTNRINEDIEFSIELFEGEWMNQSTVYNYAKVVYFSLDELKEHLVQEGNSYRYIYQSNQRNIILNLINETSTTAMNIIIPKDVFEINLYSNKLKTHRLSFEVEERRQSTILFNLFNFKTTASNGYNVIKTTGEAELRIKFSGDNSLSATNMESILGHKISINPYLATDQLFIRGGVGQKGENGESNNGSKSSRRGGNGSKGYAGISADDVTLDGQITIHGGTGGEGGRGGNRESWGILVDGDGGNGGNGGKGGSAVYAINIDYTSTVILQGGSGGNPGDGGNGGGLGYSNGVPGSKGQNGQPIEKKE